MNIFYYCYSYQLDGKQEQELLCSFDQLLDFPHGLESALIELKGVELDVEQKVLEKVLAYARQS